MALDYLQAPEIKKEQVVALDYLQAPEIKEQVVATMENFYSVLETNMAAEESSKRGLE